MSDNSPYLNRINVQSIIYYKICKEHYKKYLKCKKQLPSKLPFLKAKASNNPKLLSVIDEMFKCRIIVITLAQMCLEAFIYDYAATNLSDKFVKDNLDNLKLTSKWVVIPQLVTGRKFPRDSHSYELLVNLTKIRNRLVHSKSYRKPKDVIEQAKKYLTAGEEIEKVHIAYQAIKELFIELDKLDKSPHKCGWWEFYEKEFK